LHPSFELPPALAGGKNYDYYVIAFSQIISAKAFLLILNYFDWAKAQSY